MDSGNGEKKSKGASRCFDWDVDGLSVWCDGTSEEPCTAREPCDECFEASFVELEWHRYESSPYWTGGPPSEPRAEGHR